MIQVLTGTIYKRYSQAGYHKIKNIKSKILKHKSRMNIFAYVLLANTISGFALFRRKRFEKIENEENYIENALVELRLANCHEIGKMLRNDLYQNTARKCSIFVNCRNLILEKIENAKTLCRVTSDTFYN